MLKTIGLELVNADKNTIKELEYLAELIGGELKTEKLPYRKRVVLLSYDTDLLKRSYRQKLGRKEKRLENGIELIELEKQIKEKGSEQVAKDLGIGRATLFRKIKKAKETESKVVR
jgi:transcriptional regulator with PAS, ATPase and Fis domain